MAQEARMQAALQQLQQHIGALQKQIVRTRQVATAAQAELALLHAGRSPTMPVEFTSQFGEDLIAWQLLGGQLQGFFVEAGAFDGYRYSVTYPFEAIGWTGLLVEALPDAAERCRARRPKSRVVHAALSDGNGPQTAPFHVVEDQYGGMLSFLKPTEQHAAAIRGARQKTIDVSVTTLNALLADHDGPIDLLVLDVEGGELDVLDGLDLDRYRPRMLLIEDNSHGRDPALRSYMSSFPYEMACRVAVNDVYVRADEAEVLERVKWMKMG